MSKMKYFLIVAAICIGFIPAYSCAQNTGKESQATITDVAPFEKDTLTIVKADGEEIPLNIELALTPPQQAKGLMFREEMDEDAGMLFVFEGEAERRFWMKNTLIPLDMIFIKDNGVVHHIHENAIPHDPSPVSSNGAVRAVLEINGGTSRKLGLKPGHTIKHAVFQNVNFK